MKRFLVTEEEKKDILNLYKKNVIKESPSCMCPDGTFNHSCCGGGQTFNLSAMSEEERQKALAIANQIISQNKQITQSNIAKETKAEVAELTNQISKLIENLKNPNNRATRKAIQNQIDIYNKQIENLKGGSERLEKGSGDRSADEKVNAWIRVAQTFLGLISTFFLLKSKMGNNNSGNVGDDGGVG